MKNILLTVHKFFPAHRAGTEVLSLKVAQELQRRGYKVSVLTADPPDMDARRDKLAQNGKELKHYEYAGIPVYCLSEEARLKNNSFTNEYYHPYLKVHYESIFDQFAPDLVHCFHLQNLSTSLIETANERHIPIFYSATDFWLICPIVQLRKNDGSNCCGPNNPAFNCLTCYTPKLLPKKEELAEAIAKKYPAFWKGIVGFTPLMKELVSSTAQLLFNLKKAPSAIAATLERPNVLRQFASELKAITVPTKLMEKLFVANGFDPERIHHIPYGIDTEPLLVGKNKKASDELRIAFIGTLAEHKGADLLIKAFMRLSEKAKASLTIYGDLNQFPDYGAYLQKLVRDQSPLAKKISFAGTFPNDQIGEIFREIDVLVVPSRWYENTPLVIQSALAAKTPLIVTNLGGMSELIKEGVNGLLFETNNVDSLYQQLNKLIEDENLLAKLVSNIGEQRSVKDMVDDLERLYAQ